MNTYFISIVIVNISIALVGILAFRQIQGMSYGVNIRDELSKKDNYAFGLSFSGGAFAYSLIIAASVTGDPANSWLTEGVNILTYTILGLALLKIGSVIFDRFIFHKFSVKESVLKENIGAGIVQMANFVAIGIIVSASINWVEVETYDGFIIVIANFIAAQFTLLVVTLIRTRIYKKRHENEHLQDAISAGNYALAIRYAGHLIAAAVAVSSIGEIIPYSIDNPWLSSMYWFVAGLALVAVISLLAGFARKIILAGIDVIEEVDKQKNYGIAMIEATIFIALANIIAPVLTVADSLL